MSMLRYRIIPNAECDTVMLPKNGEMKCVGEIYMKTTFVTKRDPTKHIMRQWNAYGFDMGIIDSGLFETIIIQEPKKQWLITVKDLKMYAQVQHPEGEDRQYFIDIKHLIEV